MAAFARPALAVEEIVKLLGDEQAREERENHSVRQH
jgi:hypothetical protein